MLNEKLTRFAVLPDDRRVMLGIDKGCRLEAGYVYEIREMFDELIIKKIGKYALPPKAMDGDEIRGTSELADVNTQIFYGLHLLTEDEYQRKIKTKKD